MHRFTARILLWLMLPLWLYAQPYDSLLLSDLSAFRPTAANWQIAGSVTADINKDYVLKTGQGAGVLVNLPSDKARGNIQTGLEHGDLDLDLEFMMARHSNSGIYLQGRYEIQLLDSWGKQTITYGDCGGIYHRWDESRPEGKKGYEGSAPLMNASRAPGLWQRLEISFRAPRFDAKGNKVENARILSVRLNGVTIHENVELTGPTRGGMTPEAERGPLFIQGDHGPVAFRHIRYRLYDQAPLRVAEWRWAEYDFQGQGFPETDKLKPVAQGVTGKLSPEMVRRDAQFALRLTGQAEFPVAGTYRFNLFAPGLSLLKIDGKAVIPSSWWEGSGQVALSAGRHELELVYYKPDSWYPSGLDLSISGPGLRTHSLSPAGAIPAGSMSAPIFVDNGQEPVILRSFMDFHNPGKKSPHRVTHAISVGFPGEVSYSYDLKNGALFQVWRGGFLETTPMWNDRGDGSSRPNGSVLPLVDAPAFAKLDSPSAAWPDSVAIYENFRPMGYRFDEQGRPVYRFTAYGAEVEDHIVPVNEGRQLTRTLSLKGSNEPGLQLRLARGKRIEMVAEGLYMVDQQYYVQLPPKASFRAQVRDLGGTQELLAALQGVSQVQYDIIW